jgi:hypothetical protein
VITLYVHIEGLEATLLDFEQLPDPSAVLLIGKNPRRRDGKDVSYVLGEVTTIMIPVNRVTFIEVMSAEEEEDFETFIRE